MRFFTVCLLLPALAGAAHAQSSTPSYTEEERLRQLDLTTVAVSPGRWSWSAFAQGTASAVERVSGADVAAGGELVYAYDDCRFVVAGGQARLAFGPDGRVAPSAEQWLSFCLFRAPLFSFEIGHHLEWDVRPAFDAPRTLLRRPFSRESLWFTYKMVDWRPPATSADATTDDHLLFGAVTPRFAFTRQDDGTSGPHDVLDAQVDFITFRYERRRPTSAIGAAFGDSGFDLFRVRVASQSRALDDTVMRMSVLGLDGVRLGSPRVVLDGDVGFSQGGLSTPYDPADAMKPPLLQAMGFTASAGVRVGGAKIAGGARWDRGLAPTIDDRIAAEDRVSGWLALPRLGVTSRAWLARTKSFGVSAAPEDDLTYGAGVDYTHELPHGLRFGATAELARTYYAALDAGAAPVPGAAVRLLAVLSARLTR